MALPWWLRGGLTGGAALLKEHLKKKGKELVGEARKKAIAKFAKKKKNGKKEKPKKKYTISRKKLREMGERETKGSKIDFRELDSTQEEFKKAFTKLKPKTQASVKRYKKATDAVNRRKAIGEEDRILRSQRRGGYGRTGHSISGDIKGEADIKKFSDSLLKQDKQVARHVKGLQKLKQIRDYLKKQKIKKYTYTDARGKAETSKDIQQLVKKYELDPKLAKSAKADFQRIQKKKDKDRFKKKDGKKKGKQDGAKPKMSQDIMEKIKKHHDIIVPISALGAGGALSYLKRKKKDAKKKGKQGD